MSSILYIDFKLISCIFTIRYNIINWKCSHEKGIRKYICSTYILHFLNEEWKSKDACQNETLLEFTTITKINNSNYPPLNLLPTSLPDGNSSHSLDRPVTNCWREEGEGRKAEVCFKNYEWKRENDFDGRFISCGPGRHHIVQDGCPRHRLPFIPKTKTFPFLRQLLTMEYTQVLVCIYLQ